MCSCSEAQVWPRFAQGPPPLLPARERPHGAGGAPRGEPALPRPARRRPAPEAGRARLLHSERGYQSLPAAGRKVRRPQGSEEAPGRPPGDASPSRPAGGSRARAPIHTWLRRGRPRPRALCRTCPRASPPANAAGPGRLRCHTARRWRGLWRGRPCLALLLLLLPAPAAQGPCPPAPAAAPARSK